MLNSTAISAIIGGQMLNVIHCYGNEVLGRCGTRITSSFGSVLIGAISGCIAEKIGMVGTSNKLKCS